MKRFLSMILAVLMIVPLFVFGTTAAEQTECTYMRNNIAAKANASDTGVSGQVNHTLVTDGNRETGSFGDHNSKSFSYILEYDEEHLFDEVVVVVNGKGSCPSSWVSYKEVTNNNFVFQIKMFNKAGEVVYSTDPDNPPPTVDRETYSTTEDEIAWEPVNASKIEVIVQSNYAGGQCIIWEIEAYSGSYGKHAWELTDTVESTCEESGYNEYTCSCGETKKEKLPMSVDHKWDAGVVSTPATDAEEGVKTYTCSVCKETRTEAIPATVHNAFDEGVVTAPTCTEMGYTTFTCTHCNTYTHKGNYVNALGHDIDDGEMTVKPTFTTTGKMLYSCQRDDCEYSYDEDLAKVWYRDYEILIGADDATLTEEFVGTTDPFDKNSSKDKIFDGIVMENPWGSNSDNYWKAPCGTGKSGKLIIDFKYEYYLTIAKFYIYANELGFTIKMYDGADEIVYEIEKISFSLTNTPEKPLVFQSEIIGQKVKKIVIESTNQNGKSPWISELEIFAHECLYDEADITNIVEIPEECKTTFDGTCWICKELRTGVTVYHHTYEQENGADKVEVTTPVTCHSDGAGTKTCTVCEDVCDVVIPATGNHNFDDGKEEIVTQNNCGVAGEAYKKCANTGCTATSEHYTLEPTGKHSYSWKVLEEPAADYTHAGMQSYVCRTCSLKDPSTEDKPTTPKRLNCVEGQAWSIRSTGYVSARATFKLDLDLLESIEDSFDVKVYGVVIKGEEEKLVQVYGKGAKGKISEDGVFSLVVKNAGLKDEYNYEVRVEISCKADDTTASTSTSKKSLSGFSGTVSTYEVAQSLLKSEIDETMIAFYQGIIDSVPME